MKPKKCINKNLSAIGIDIFGIELIYFLYLLFFKLFKISSF